MNNRAGNHCTCPLLNSLLSGCHQKTPLICLQHAPFGLFLLFLCHCRAKVNCTHKPLSFSAADDSLLESGNGAPRVPFIILSLESLPKTPFSHMHISLLKCQNNFKEELILLRRNELTIDLDFKIGSFQERDSPNTFPTPLCSPAPQGSHQPLLPLPPASTPLRKRFFSSTLITCLSSESCGLK